MILYFTTAELSELISIGLGQTSFRRAPEITDVEIRNGRFRVEVESDKSSDGADQDAEQPEAVASNA